MGGAWAKCPSALRGMDDVFLAARNGWEHILQRNPRDFDRCPDPLRELDGITSARVDGWRAVLELDPREYDNCPADLRNIDALVTARSSGWVGLLHRDPLAFDACAPELKSMSSITQARIDGWVKLLRHDPHAVDRYPCELVAAEPLLSELVLAWNRRVAMAPLSFGRCPPDIKRLVMKEALRAGWACLLKVNPKQFPAAPSDVSSSVMCQEAHLEGWVALLRGNPDEYDHCPEALRGLEPIVKAMRWIPYVKARPERLSRLPFDWTRNNLLRSAFALIWRRHLEENWHEVLTCPEVLMDDPLLSPAAKRALALLVLADLELWRKQREMNTRGQVQIAESRQGYGA